MWKQVGFYMCVCVCVCIRTCGCVFVCVICHGVHVETRGQPQQPDRALLVRESLYCSLHWVPVSPGLEHPRIRKSLPISL